MPTRALVLSLLIACGGSNPEPKAAAAQPPAPTKPEPTCASAMQHAVDVVSKENEKTATPEQIAKAREISAKLLPAAVAACNEDKWSPAVLRCFEDAPAAQQGRCEEMMTKQQTDSLDKRLEALE